MDASTSHVKRYKPYLPPNEVERLSAKQRGKLSASREDRARQQACALIDAVGVRCGFPRRTIATAQTLYMRFHLFFPYSDFHYIEVALTTLYVSSKLHDTLKKPRDIILASYALRFPQFIKRGGSGGGHVDMTAVDPNMLEHERRRVLSIERLVLETMCFAFGVAVPFPLVVKLGKRMGLGKEAVKAGWRVAVDCHRTQAPLSYPPHIIALGSLYASALLSSVTTNPHAELPDGDAGRIVAQLGSEGKWETEYSASASSLDDVAHAILDLYHTLLSTPANDPSLQLFSPSPVSPREPGRSRSSRPSPAPLAAASTAFSLPAQWSVQALTELKIHLRNRRPGAPPLSWEELEMATSEGDVEGMGRNDATVRFVWDQDEEM